MRPRTAVTTLILSVGVLGAAWHQGATHSGTGTAPPGVHVVALPPSTPSPSASRTRKAAGRKHSTAATAPTHRTVDGATVSTPYGDVQVAIVLSGTRITDVKALHLTDANQHSVDISARAAPTLRREVLAHQSAKVDAVSGATYTSQGYLTSLQAALDAAHL